MSAALNDESSLLQEVFAKIPSAVVIIDEHGVIKKANLTALRLLGEPVLEGRRWVEVITKVFRPRNDDGHEISTCDGRRLRVATLPLTMGQLVQMTDLTETRLLQEKMAHMERLSSLGRMAASLAHQIRTPLSAAMLYASNLGNAGLPPAAHQRFQEKLVNRLQALEAQVSDILMFARSNDLQVSEIDAADLLVQTANNVTAVLTRNQAHLLTVVEPNAHFPILGSASSLNGALSNLIVNGIEAGAKNVVLKLEQIGERVIFSVANDGPPIPEELKTKIFEPFFTSKSSGTGLGLAVVSAVTKVHQGILSLETWAAPFFTVFTVSLPRYVATAPAPAPEVTKAVKAVVTAQDSQLLSTAAQADAESLADAESEAEAETEAKVENVAPATAPAAPTEAIAPVVPVTPTASAPAASAAQAEPTVAPVQPEIEVAASEGMAGSASPVPESAPQAEIEAAEAEAAKVETTMADAKAEPEIVAPNEVSEPAQAGAAASDATVDDAAVLTEPEPTEPVSPTAAATASAEDAGGEAGDESEALIAAESTELAAEAAAAEAVASDGEAHKMPERAAEAELVGNEIETEIATEVVTAPESVASPESTVVAAANEAAEHVAETEPAASEVPSVPVAQVELVVPTAAEADAVAEDFAAQETHEAETLHEEDDELSDYGEGAEELEHLANAVAQEHPYQESNTEDLSEVSAAHSAAASVKAAEAMAAEEVVAVQDAQAKANDEFGLGSEEEVALTESFPLNAADGQAAGDVAAESESTHVPTDAMEPFSDDDGGAYAEEYADSNEYADEDDESAFAADPDVTSRDDGFGTDGFATDGFSTNSTNGLSADPEELEREEKMANKATAIALAMYNTQQKAANAYAPAPQMALAALAESGEGEDVPLEQTELAEQLAAAESRSLNDSEDDDIESIEQLELAAKIRQAALGEYGDNDESMPQAVGRDLPPVAPTIKNQLVGAKPSRGGIADLAMAGVMPAMPAGAAAKAVAPTKRASATKSRSAHRNKANARVNANANANTNVNAGAAVSANNAGAEANNGLNVRVLGQDRKGFKQVEIELPRNTERHDSN